MSPPLASASLSASRVADDWSAPKPDALGDLLGAYAAATKVEAPPGDAAAGLVADFRYLAAAERLVVAQSTLSFWAAFLSRAREIHAVSYTHLTLPTKA